MTPGALKPGALKSGALKSGALKSGARWFALGLVLLPVAVVAGAVLIARTSWFMERTMDPWIRNVDRNFAVSGEDCAVLVFGDSTALTGVSPEAIAAATGMTACNISQTVGSLGVNGTLALDAFLKKNPRPQFLLLVFAPENLHANRSWRHLKYAEGVLELARHEGAGTVMVTLVGHPGQALGFSAWVYENTVREWLGRPYFSRQLFVGAMDLRHTSGLNKPPQTRCTEAGSLGRAGDRESSGENSQGEDSVAVDAAWVAAVATEICGESGKSDRAGVAGAGVRCASGVLFRASGWGGGQRDGAVSGGTVQRSRSSLHAGRGTEILQRDCGAAA